LDDAFVSHDGIDHELEAMSDRPLDVEMLLDVIGTVPIHGLWEVDRFLLTLASPLAPAHFS
jgi:hypothetical protein